LKSWLGFSFTVKNKEEEVKGLFEFYFLGFRDGYLV